MKDVDKMLKEMSEKEKKENTNEDNFWLWLIPCLLLLNNNSDKQQPIINIYVGDE